MITNGIMTIQNKETKEHRTFKVHTVRKGALEGRRLVSLLTGPDNEHSYQGFGFISESGNSIQLWQRFSGSSAFRYYTKLVEVAAEALGEGIKSEYETVSADVQMPKAAYTVTLSKRCLCCNARLTTPRSLAAGYGPECSARLGLEW